MKIRKTCESQIDWSEIEKTEDKRGSIFLEDKFQMLRNIFLERSKKKRGITHHNALKMEQWRENLSSLASIALSRMKAESTLTTNAIVVRSKRVAISSRHMGGVCRHE